MKQGLPSQPVRIIGFKSLPKAGDPILCVASEEEAEELVQQRLMLAAQEGNGSDRPDVPKDVVIQIPGMRSRDAVRAQRVHEKAALEGDDGTIRIPIVVKADADGSLAAIRESLITLGKQAKKYKVMIDPVAEGIGTVTASDIQMAKESDATIFAFGLKKIDDYTLSLAESEKVAIRSNDIIYSLLDEAKVAFGRHLPRIPVEHVHGRATVRAIFQIDGEDSVEKIAGLNVNDGFLYRSKTVVNGRPAECHFRVLRDGKRISPDGEVVTASSLRKFKELVESVRRGEECGLALVGFSDFEEGDVIECYSIEMQHATLS